MAAGIAACAVLTAAGCTSDEAPQDPVWASGAEVYLDSWGAASRVGFTNAAPFYAAGVHQDIREVVNFEGMGRPQVVQNARDNFQAPPRFFLGWDQSDAGGGTGDEPIYLSREGAVAVNADSGTVLHLAQVLTITDQGIIDEEVPGSIQALDEMVEVTQAELDPIALGYVEAWASEDPDRVSRLYSKDALLRDSIGGITARGSAGISRLGSEPAATGGFPGATLRGLPASGGPAYFVNGPFLGRSDMVDQLVLLIDVGAEDGCPGPVAVVLALDPDMRVTREERYHRIDALRRCLPTGERPSGWWDEAQIPVTPGIGRTGWVSAPTHDIAVWNGDPRVDPIIDWARQRFAQAGLPPPQPTSVTFMPPADGDRWEAFGFLTGSDAPDLGLPFTASEACPDGPCQWPTAVRAAILHEFAHLWLARGSYQGTPSYEVPWTRVKNFLAAHNLTWHDPAVAWGQQGVERAAETIAWGLMDQPYVVDPRLGRLTCDQLTADFQTLTYSLPNPRACADSTRGTGGAQ